MRSRFLELKPEAILLREKGDSLPDIEKKLGVPRSTLSGWLRKVELTSNQKAALEKRHSDALVFARTKAAESHRNAKKNRIQDIKDRVDSEYGKDDFNRKELEIALALLYLGEGTKGRNGLGLGNSDPMVMKFYIDALYKLYRIQTDSLYAQLHYAQLYLRADQDEVALKEFWSAETGVNHFIKSIWDERTTGRPTYPHYKGVCYVGGGGVEIQRRLMYLAEVLCKKKMGD